MSTDKIIPKYGLIQQSSNSSIGILKRLLGIEYILAVKTQNFHWNLIGPGFIQLHELFGKQYSVSQQFIDRIAEQLRKYGVSSPGSLSEFLMINQTSNSNIAETPGSLISQNIAISALYKDNESIIQFINNNVSVVIDLSTQTLLSEILDSHMKNSWMLKSHLE